MKIRKIIFIIMVIFIVITNLQIVKAKENYSLNTVVNAQENNELNLEISIDDAGLKIIGMQGTINYDQDVLELKELKNTKEGWNVTALNKETGAFLLEITDDLFYDENAYIESGDKILEAVFNVKQNKNTEVKITDIKIVNSNFETVDVEENTTLARLGNNNAIILIVVIAICVIIVAIIVLRKVKNK